MHQVEMVFGNNIFIVIQESDLSFDVGHVEGPKFNTSIAGSSRPVTTMNLKSLLYKSP
jgi:hypothetical protein